MLYLVHHADAVGPEVDSQRPLSQGGRIHADTIAQRAKERGVMPVVISHSGKLRARQTAEAFWRTCNPLAVCSAVRGLQPADPPEWTKDQVTGVSGDLMLVGHMPSLPKILRLLTGDESAEFPLHGLVALEEDAGKWIERFRLL